MSRDDWRSGAVGRSGAARGNMATLAVVVLLSACTSGSIPESAAARVPAPPRAGQTAGDTLWLLGPDRTEDAVRADDTEQSLIARYGAANVRRELVDEGEGVLNPGTALFPDDSSRRLTILWRDTVSYRYPVRVAIDGSPSRWLVAPGVRIGTTLEELERLNGGPFALLGFGGHLPGYVQDWQGGALAHFAVRDDPYGWHRVVITLQPMDSLPADADPDRYTNEARYLSSDPGLRKLRPRVTSIAVGPR